MLSLLLSTVFALVSITQTARINPDVPVRSDSTYELEMLMSGNAGGPAPPVPVQGQAASEGSLEYLIDDAAKEKLGEALYDNQLWTLRRNASVYAWQDFSSKVIFASVLLLVLIGVFFAGVQFFGGYPSGSSSDAREAPSEVELSVKGISVSSPFLGVIILVISLGFFYLYLAYVYPISLTV